MPLCIPCKPNLKTPEELLYKLKNICETNDPYIFNEKIDEKYLNIKEIENRIKNGYDIVGRENYFEKVELDETFPKYIIENKENYQDWIV